MPKALVNRSIEEIIIVYSAIIMAITITPFAFFRFVNGQHIVAAIELLSVFMMAGMGMYVWKTRNVKYMKVVISVFMLTGLVIFNYLLGSSILFWLYPIIMTTYFLNNLKVSATLVTIASIALIPLLVQQKTTIEVISIVITMVICQLFGFLLSKKIRQQYLIMEELANQDGLTGASNRRAFEERIEFLHNFSARHKRGSESTVSLIIFDIDNFKMINDEYGHLEGDSILIKLTELFKTKIRGIDQLYRYGGEEFVVIANGADTLKATELAEKMRILLEESDISEHTKVTASFGVAELQKHEKPHRWIERADNAMYRAKRAGRNRVFMANFDPVNKEFSYNMNVYDITSQSIK